MDHSSVVFITGASSGIGRATAVYFQKRGWHVVASMRNTRDAGALRFLERVTIVPVDVTRTESIKRSVASVIARFGRIHVLVNNAGYGLLGPFEGASEKDIEHEMNVNVMGVIRMTRAVLPNMRKHKDGVIINLSSIAGRIGFPYYSMYNASKWAVEGMSESLSHELSLFGIRIKIVEPGPIRTDFFGRSAVYVKHAEASYEQGQQRTFGSMKKNNQTFADDPAVVARIIYKAATDASVRLRYPAGKIAPLLLLVRRVLPEGLFLRWVRKQLV